MWQWQIKRNVSKLNDDAATCTDAEEMQPCAAVTGREICII